MVCQECNILKTEASYWRNWTRHAVRTYQPSLHPVQAFLAEPKVGVSIATGSSHRDHSLVPLGLYPHHSGGAETLGEWYQQFLSQGGTSSSPVIVSEVDASNKRLLVWRWWTYQLLSDPLSAFGQKFEIRVGVNVEDIYQFGLEKGPNVDPLLVNLLNSRTK